MKRGVLVISHGSRESDWVEHVDTAVRRAAEGIDVAVVSAFLEIVEGRLIQDGIHELEQMGATEIYVLPFFVSSGSKHVDEISQAFGYPPVTDFIGDLGKFEVDVKVVYGVPIDDDPEIAELMLEHTSELSQDPSKEALLLIGHGSKLPLFRERWQAGLSGLSEKLCVLGGFARAEYATLLPDEASSKLREMQQMRPDESIIVVPVFLSQGYFTNYVIPKRLNGLDYRYNGRAMLPHAAVERWLTRQITDWLSQTVKVG